MLYKIVRIIDYTAAAAAVLGIMLMILGVKPVGLIMAISGIVVVAAVSFFCRYMRRKEQRAMMGIMSLRNTFEKGMKS